MGYIVGIDISEKQGTLSAAQKAAIAQKAAFVIHRFGYRGYGTGLIKKDVQLDANLRWLDSIGMPHELYFFSQAINAAEGAGEADAMHNHCDIRNGFTWIDTELANKGNGRADKISKESRTAAILAFCNRVEQLGGNAGIYASTAWFTERLNMAALAGIPLWVADYRGYCGRTTDRLIWQYSSKNALGIAGFGGLDCNRRYTGVAAANAATVASTSNTPYKSFVLAVQSAVGTKIDGIAGAKTLAATPTISAKKNRTHKAVRAVQVYLNASGFDCGTADGVAGARFDAAVRKYQQANGCVTDGEITARGKTWKKLLKLA